MKIRYKESGKVFFNNNEYECKLYLSKYNDIIVIKIYDPDKDTVSIIDMPFNINYLSGKLENNQSFILYDLVRTKANKNLSLNPMVTEYTYQAKYLADKIGLDNCNEPLFSRAQYVLKDIIRWGQMSFYKNGKNHELISQQILEIPLYQNENYSIIYKVCGTPLPMMLDEALLYENIKLKQDGIIEICTMSNQKLEYFNSEFDKIKNLIEYCTLRKEHIKHVSMYSNDLYYDFGDHTKQRPITIYGYQIKDTQPKKAPTIQQFRSWITLSELIEGDCFQLYYDKYAQLEPIFELYLEPFHNDMSTRRIFLNIVQALETYHTSFVAKDFKEYSKRVKKICEGMPVEMKRQVNELLLPDSENNSEDDKKTNIALKYRLSDLLYAENHVQFDIGGISISEYSNKIAYTRNYYTHYGAKNADQSKLIPEERLMIYTRALYAVLDYYILNELGYINDYSRIMGIINDRWGNISLQLKYLDLSEQN